VVGEVRCWFSVETRGVFEVSFGEDGDDVVDPVDQSADL
jgi:hypothetical protein